MQDPRGTKRSKESPARHPTRKKDIALKRIAKKKRQEELLQAEKSIEKDQKGENPGTETTLDSTAKAWETGFIPVVSKNRRDRSKQASDSDSSSYDLDSDDEFPSLSKTVEAIKKSSKNRSINAKLKDPPASARVNTSSLARAVATMKPQVKPTPALNNGRDDIIAVHNGDDVIEVQDDDDTHNETMGNTVNSFQDLSISIDSDATYHPPGVLDDPEEQGQDLIDTSLEGLGELIPKISIHLRNIYDDRNIRPTVVEKEVNDIIAEAQHYLDPDLLQFHRPDMPPHPEPMSRTERIALKKLRRDIAADLAALESDSDSSPQETDVLSDEDTSSDNSVIRPVAKSKTLLDESEGSEHSSDSSVLDIYHPPDKVYSPPRRQDLNTKTKHAKFAPLIESDPVPSPPKATDSNIVVDGPPAPAPADTVIPPLLPPPISPSQDTTYSAAAEIPGSTNDPRPTAFTSQPRPLPDRNVDIRYQCTIKLQRTELAQVNGKLSELFATKVKFLLTTAQEAAGSTRLGLRVWADPKTPSNAAHSSPGRTYWSADEIPTGKTIAHGKTLKAITGISPSRSLPLNAPKRKDGSGPEQYAAKIRFVTDQPEDLDLSLPEVGSALNEVLLGDTAKGQESFWFSKSPIACQTAFPETIGWLYGSTKSVHSPSLEAELRTALRIDEHIAIGLEWKRIQEQRSPGGQYKRSTTPYDPENPPASALHLVVDRLYFQTIKRRAAKKLKSKSGYRPQGMQLRLVPVFGSPMVILTKEQKSNMIEMARKQRFLNNRHATNLPMVPYLADAELELEDQFGMRWSFLRFIMSATPPGMPTKRLFLSFSLSWNGDGYIPVVAKQWMVLAQEKIDMAPVECLYLFGQDARRWFNQDYLEAYKDMTWSPDKETISSPATLALQKISEEDTFDMGLDWRNYDPDGTTDVSARPTATGMAAPTSGPSTPAPNSAIFQPPSNLDDFSVRSFGTALGRSISEQTANLHAAQKATLADTSSPPMVGDIQFSIPATDIPAHAIRDFDDASSIGGSTAARTTESTRVNLYKEREKNDELAVANEELLERLAQMEAAMKGLQAAQGASSDSNAADMDISRDPVEPVEPAGTASGSAGQGS